jgi:hypothetical protein
LNFLRFSVAAVPRPKVLCIFVARVLPYNSVE